MNALAEAIGQLCKAVLPIPEESYPGNPDSSVAVCTLASVGLLKKFRDSEVLGRVSIAGRLFSENRGIDSVMEHLYRNKKIETIILCGRDAWGHKAGHSLLALHRNGVDKDNRIIGSASPDPRLTVSRSKIAHFQDNVTIVNLINEEDFEAIAGRIGG